jgi:ribosomal protein S15P/S13E
MRAIVDGNPLRSRRLFLSPALSTAIRFTTKDVTLSPEDLHFLITRLNSVAGHLSNHSDGTRQLDARTSKNLERKMEEIEARIRKIFSEKVD